MVSPVSAQQQHRKERRAFLALQQWRLAGPNLSKLSHHPRDVDAVQVALDLGDPGATGDRLDAAHQHRRHRDIQDADRDEGEERVPERRVVWIAGSAHGGVVLFELVHVISDGVECPVVLEVTQYFDTEVDAGGHEPGHRPGCDRQQPPVHLQQAIRIFKDAWARPCDSVRLQHTRTHTHTHATAHTPNAKLPNSEVAVAAPQFQPSSRVSVSGPAL